MRERERIESGGRVVRGTTFNGGNRDKFSVMKVPRQCPLVLLVKVCRTDRRAFGSGEGRVMRSGAKREVEQSLTAFDRNF
jgi:hypothetical protein